MAVSSSYETAMEALSSLISSRKRGDGSKRSEKFDLMSRYLKTLDLEDRIGGLKIIHVAGTKGKGSTCTFCEAVLRECGFRTGLFTSPHLIDVTERYQINGLDICKDDFLHYFWDCWNQLKEKTGENLPMPALFQFLTLLAFKIFLSEKVDVAILEVGIGGLLDCTNVVKDPVVCGITSLGMDHMEILGTCMQGIPLKRLLMKRLGSLSIHFEEFSENHGCLTMHMKPDVPAFTVCQLPEAMSVLQERATQLMIPLNEAKPLNPGMLDKLKLGLDGDHQLSNAGLAVALCKSWLQRTKHSRCHDDLETGLPEAFLRGLSTASLPGRAQIITDRPQKLPNKSGVIEISGELTFYLDGAHTPESMEVCASWFSNTVKVDQDEEVSLQPNIENQMGHSKRFTKISKKILLFNCMEVRDPQIMLPQLINTCSSSGVYFSKALFVPSMSQYHRVDSGASAVSLDPLKDVSWQLSLQRTWEKLTNGKGVSFDNRFNNEKSEDLLISGALHSEASEKWTSTGKHLGSSSVIPSLPLALKWLRACAAENPSLRLQVLVTGSMHLVGDVLKLLKK